MSRVAFLGLGAMGRAMATRLLDAGHELRVWNRTSGRDAELVEAAALPAASPADAVRDAEVVITMLTDPRALEDVLFGPEGAAAAISERTTLIEMSTVGPTALRSLAERLTPSPVLDAPVFGSVPTAERGGLTIIVGGDRDVFERHRELLDALGTTTYVGASAEAAMLKLVGNAATVATLVSLAELLGLTDRYGLGQDVVLDTLGMGPLASLIERWRERLEGRYDRPDFRLALAWKDLGLVLDESRTLDTELRVTRTAADRLDEAMDAGLGDQDVGAVIGFLRR